MKRKGNLYHQVYSLENLYLADEKARKGKMNNPGVKAHMAEQDNNILILHDMLKNKTYRTSRYSTFWIETPKLREIFKLPYFPDRVTHHAVMNVTRDIFTECFIAKTYSCLKGRGIHKALRDLRKALRNKEKTVYYLQFDIKKFYPSVDHDILKKLLRRKFKDKDLLWLMDEIIDSAPGLPIGNYLSQFFGNYYLNGFDHWLKEEMGVHDYFRYMDDCIILHWDKKVLHELLHKIIDYLATHLKLELKGNYRICPVSCGIDFVGYVTRHRYVLLRKSIKQRFARMVRRRPNKKSVDAYNGWLKHCNSKHLQKKLLTHEVLQRIQH